MTNKELIEKLQKLPLDVEVIFGVENGDDMGGYIVPITIINPTLHHVIIEPGRPGRRTLYCYNGGVGTPIIIIETDEHFVYKGLEDYGHETS